MWGKYKKRHPGVRFGRNSFKRLCHAKHEDSSLQAVFEGAAEARAHILLCALADP